MPPEISSKISFVSSLCSGCFLMWFYTQVSSGFLQRDALKEKEIPCQSLKQGYGILIRTTACLLFYLTVTWKCSSRKHRRDICHTSENVKRRYCGELWELLEARFYKAVTTHLRLTVKTWQLVSWDIKQHSLILSHTLQGHLTDFIDSRVFFCMFDYYNTYPHRQMSHLGVQNCTETAEMWKDVMRHYNEVAHSPKLPLSVAATSFMNWQHQSS